MLSVSFIHNNPKAIAEIKSTIKHVFPDKDADAIYQLLEDYDSAFLTAREYLAFYYSISTKTVTKYINDNGLIKEWGIIESSIFDSGINALYQFYDETADEHRNILVRSLKLLNTSISPIGKKNKRIKMLRSYRNNRAAHYGDDYDKESSNITYDLPIQILETLRRDRQHFDKKYFNSWNQLYDDIIKPFHETSRRIEQILNWDLNFDKSNAELINYLNEVILTV